MLWAIFHLPGFDFGCDGYGCELLTGSEAPDGEPETGPSSSRGSGSLRTDFSIRCRDIDISTLSTIHNPQSVNSGRKSVRVLPRSLSLSHHSRHERKLAKNRL